MIYKSLGVFKDIHRKMAWLQERQHLISRNVLNSHQPSAKPEDLKAFKRMSRTDRSVPLAQTSTKHIAMPLEASGDESFRVQKVVNPNNVDKTGNAISLEEEMIKSSETGRQFKETTAFAERLYRLRKIALGKK